MRLPHRQRCRQKYCGLDLGDELTRILSLDLYVVTLLVLIHMQRVVPSYSLVRGDPVRLHHRDVYDCRWSILLQLLQVAFPTL